MPRDLSIITLRTDVNPWEKQEGKESDLMFARFLVFRDMGPESDRLRQTLEVLNNTGDKLTYATIKDYSSAYRWTARATAWDRYNAQADRARMVRRRRKMIDDQCKAAERLRSKALEALAHVEYQDLTAADIVRMIDLAHKIEASIYRDVEDPTAKPLDPQASLDEIANWSPSERRKRLEQLTAELSLRATRAADDDEVVA